MLGTPQNQAADWLINLDQDYTCPDDINLSQRYIMAVFYFSTEGNDWARCSAPSNFFNEEAIAQANRLCQLTLGGNAWLTPGIECEWAGLLCETFGSDQKEMKRIDIERNQLAGTIPTELAQLTSLRYLLLEEGLITGSIPSEIGRLNELEQIDLNFNIIGGSIPLEIYNLSKLRQLDLNDNELKGSLSSEIGKLEMLSFLQVENNVLTGTIPSEMGLLMMLKVATLQENLFSGSMPEELCKNRNSELAVLTTTCSTFESRPSPPFVNCTCCSECF